MDAVLTVQEKLLELALSQVIVRYAEYGDVAFRPFRRISIEMIAANKDTDTLAIVNSPKGGPSLFVYSQRVIRVNTMSFKAARDGKFENHLMSWPAQWYRSSPFVGCVFGAKPQLHPSNALVLINLVRFQSILEQRLEHESGYGFLLGRLHEFIKENLLHLADVTSMS